MGPRAGLDTEARGKILCHCRGSNPNRPVEKQYSTLRMSFWIISHITARLPSEGRSSCRSHVIFHGMLKIATSMKEIIHIRNPSFPSPCPSALLLDG
jgi:hypothetical protein